MKTIRVGIAGLGAIGSAVAQILDQGVHGLVLSAVGVRNPEAPLPIALNNSKPVAVTIDALEPLCDVVVECAPAALLPVIAMNTLKAGKTVVVLSSGALLSHPELIDIASNNGGQIHVPSGAVLGLDALIAVAEGNIHSVRMITRKPVRGLLGAPYLEQNSIDISTITEPTMIFQGSPREAAIGFPANLNVAASVSMAGIGPDRTTLEIWADPSLTRNVHRVEVDSDAAILSMEIQSVPSSNPKTSRITAQSVIALLRKLRAPLCMGT